jgi:flagellar FliL protein
MAEETAQPKSDSGTSRTKQISLAVTVLLAGIGIGAYLFFSGSVSSLSPAGEEARSEQQAQQIGIMVDLDSFIVNILDDVETRYLKAAITLEVESEAVVSELRQRMPQIKDAILLHVGNKTFAELNDLQGKLQLRAELLHQINGLLTSGKVRRIYFTDFVVQ